MPAEKCTVVNITEKTNDYGSFCVLKLVSEGKTDVLGVSTGRTYYALRKSTTLALNSSIEIDIADFKVETREWAIPDGDRAGEIVTLTYLLPL